MNSETLDNFKQEEDLQAKTVLSESYDKVQQEFEEAREKVESLAREHSRISRHIEGRVKKIIKSRTEAEELESRRIRTLLYLGKKFYRESNFEAALEKWEQILVLDPDNAEVIPLMQDAEEAVRLASEKKMMQEEENRLQQKAIKAHIIDAKRAYREEDYKKAIASWDIAITLGADEEKLRVDIENAEKRIAEIAEEIDKAKQAASERSRQVKELDFSGKRYFRMGDLEKAISQWEQALILEPEHKGLREQIRRAETNLKENKRLAEREKEEVSRRIRESQIQAMRSFRNREYKAAIEAWESILLLDSTQVEAFEYIKEAESKLEEIEAKKRQAEEAPRLRKLREAELKQQKEEERQSEIRAIYDKGLMLFNNAEYDMAAAEWRKILVIDSENEKVREDILRAENKVREESIRSEQKQIEEKKYNKKQRALRIEAEKYFRNDEYEKAILKWEELLELNVPDFEEVKSLVQDAEMRKKEMAQIAKSRIAEAKENKKKVNALFREGELAYYRNEFMEAILKWEEALEIESDNVSLSEAISDAREKLFQEKQEKEQAEKTKKEQEAELSRRKKTALRFEVEGDMVQALELWKKVIELNPVDKDALLHIDNLRTKIDRINEEAVVKEREEKEQKEQIIALREKEKEETRKKLNDLMTKARRSFLSEEYAQAIEYWEEVVKIDSDNIVAKENIKLAEREVLKVREAIETAKIEKEKTEKKIAQMIVLAMNYKRRGQYEDAIANFESILAVDPERFDVLDMIKDVEALMDKKQKEQDIKEEQVKQLNATRLEREALAKKQQEDFLKELFVEGLNFIENEEYSKATESFKKILLNDPHHLMAKDEIRRIENILNKKQEEKRRKETIEDNRLKAFNQALVEGERFLENEDYNNAIDVWKQALLFGINEEEIKRKIETAKLYRNEKEVMQERRIREQEQKEKDILCSLAAAEEALIEKDYRKALNEWENIILLDHRRRDVILKIEETRRRIERDKEESAKYTEEKDRKIKQLLFTATEKYHDAKYSEAIKAWEAVLIIEPSYADIDERIAEAKLQIESQHELKEKQIRKEQDEKRIKNETLKAELVSRKNTLSECYLKGVGFFNNKEYDKAITEWKKALFEDRDNEMLQAEIRRAEAKINENEISRIKKVQAERDVKAREEKEAKNKEVLMYQLSAEKFYAQKDFNKAIEMWEKIMILEPHRRDILSRIDEARRTQSEIVKHTEKQKQEKSLKLEAIKLEAIEAFSVNDYTLALKLWEQAQLLSPADNSIVEKIEEIKDLIKSAKDAEAQKEEKERLMVKEAALRKSQRIDHAFRTAIEAENNNDLKAAVVEYKNILLIDASNQDAITALERVNNIIKAEAKELSQKEAAEVQRENRIAELLIIVQQCYRQGLFEQAMEASEEALLLGAKHAEFQETMEKSVAKIKDRAREQEKAKREAKEKAKNIKEKLLSARMLFTKGETQKAIDIWTKVLSEDPECEEALDGISNGQVKLTEEAAKEEQRQEKTEELLYLSLEQENKKDYKGLLETLGEISILNPERTDVSEKMETIKEALKKQQDLKKQQTEEAEKAKQDAEDKKKQEALEQENIVKEHYARGMEYAQNQEYAKAITEWGYILLIDDDNKFIRNEISRAQNKLHEIEEAKKQQILEEEMLSRKISNTMIMAKRYYRENDYQKVIAEAEKILLMSDSHKGAQELIKQSESRLKEIKVQEAQRVREIERKEKEIEMFYQEGQQLFWQGKYLEAIEIWGKALLIEPKAQGILKAIEGAQKKISEQRDVRLRDIRERALSAKKEKEKHIKIKKVSERKEEVRKINHDAAKLLRAEKYEEAIDMYESALEIEPANHEAQEGISAVLMEIKTQDDIKEEMRLKNIEDERMIRKHEIAADKAAINGKYSEAIELLEKIIEIDPYRVQVIEKIKEVEVKLIQQKTEQKKKDMAPVMAKAAAAEKKKEAENKKKEQIEGFYNNGIEFYRNGMYENAIEEWERILLLDKDHEMAQADIAKAKEKIQAIEDIKHQGELDAIEEERKENELKQRKLEEKRIIEINRLNIRGRDYFRKGKYEKAILEWEKILIFDPENKEIAQQIEAAEINMENERRDRAEAKLRKEEEAMLRKERKKELKDYQAKLKSEKKVAAERVKTMYETAKELLMEKKHEEAKPIFEEVLVLCDKYRTSLVVSAMAKKYIRTIEDKERSDNLMQARIMATTSHMSLEDAMQVLEEKKKKENI